jgi:hypothetical protein
VYEDRDAAVGGVVATVFGDLAAAGVDDADLDTAEDVWVARVRVRDSEEVGGLLAGIDLR